jgi:hypothetical protein
MIKPTKLIAFLIQDCNKSKPKAADYEPGPGVS